jgi:ABC-2 type transport system ATP-binding protein
MSDVAISTDSLTKDYGTIRALDGVKLSVARGSIYGFLGRNGAGKTTAIRILMGLVRPTDGSVRVLDMTWPDDRLTILRRTAYVGESKCLLDSMTGEELVRFNRPFFPTWSAGLAMKCVRRLEIPMDRPFKKLSLGNRTKICLLMALAQGADLLILDEPVLGLDRVIIDQLWQLIIEDYVGDGRTVFLASHQLPDVERVADWIGIIDQGRMLLESRLDDVRTEYRRVSASGNALPMAQNHLVISVMPSGPHCEYIVTSDVERFVADLRNQGAIIVDVSPLSLSEVFLHLVRKEDPCISGNVGATRVSASSSI